MKSVFQIGMILTLFIAVPILAYRQMDIATLAWILLFMTVWIATPPLVKLLLEN